MWLLASVLHVTRGRCPLVGSVSWKQALRRLVWQDRPTVASLSLWNAVLEIFPGSYRAPCPNCSLRNAAGKMYQLSPAKLSSRMSDATAWWPLHQRGGLGCFAPDPVFRAVHRVSSGLPCFPGVSQAGKSFGARLCAGCVVAAPGWEQKAGVAAGRRHSRHLAWPWQLGSAIPRQASVSPAWHHRPGTTGCSHSMRLSQPQTGTVPALGWGVPCGDL